MKTKKPDIKESRRAFIKNTTLAGAGLAATTLVSGQALASSADGKSEPAKQQGYQLTQHVLDYYKSAAS